MITVPAELCRQAGINESSSVEMIVSALESVDDVLDGLLLSEESRSEAVDFVEKNKFCAVIVFDSDSPLDTRYIEISVGSASPIFVGIIGAEPPVQLPTKLEVLVFFHILKNHNVCSFIVEEDRVICDWRSSLKGKILIVADTIKTISSPEAQLVCSLLGVNCSRNQTVAVHSILESKSNITIPKKIDHYSPNVLELIN